MRDDRADILAALDTVADPCLAAAGFDGSVVALGLIESLVVTAEAISLSVVLTEVGCPFAHRLMDGMQRAIVRVCPGRMVTITPIWSKLWTEARVQPSLMAAFVAARRNLRAG